MTEAEFRDAVRAATSSDVRDATGKSTSGAVHSHIFDLTCDSTRICARDAPPIAVAQDSAHSALRFAMSRACADLLSKEDLT